jgi:hypothetical protein
MLIVAAHPKHHVTCLWAVASPNRLSNLQKPRCLLTTRPRVLACQVRHQESETEEEPSFRLWVRSRQAAVLQCAWKAPRSDQFTDGTLFRVQNPDGLLAFQVRNSPEMITSTLYFPWDTITPGTGGLNMTS